MMRKDLNKIRGIVKYCIFLHNFMKVRFYISTSVHFFFSWITTYDIFKRKNILSKKYILYLIKEISSEIIIILEFCLEIGSVNLRTGSPPTCMQCWSSNPLDLKVNRQTLGHKEGHSQYLVKRFRLEEGYSPERWEWLLWTGQQHIHFH